MKVTLRALAAMLSMPLFCWSQSTLSFPRVVQPREFRTMGFAIVNPAATNAAVTFTLYGEGGGSQATATESVPARGQISKLASELFPGAGRAGWVQATSSATGLQGFWLAGDLATFADGAEAAASATELVLPLVSPQSEIHIANTSEADVTVLLNLLGTDGFDLALPFPQRLPAKGFFKADMAAIFPTLDDFSAPTHLRITCRCPNANPFAATVIARDALAGPSWAVSNGAPVAGAAATIYFPYLVEGVQGGSNWRSLLGLTNLSSTLSNNVSITFTSASGATVRTNEQTLPPNGGLRFLARDLFGFVSGFQSGWVRVRSTTGLPLTGYVAYADLAAAGVAVVPPQHDAQTNLLFAHFADLPPLSTGLAMLNTNADAADLEVFAITPGGSLIGAASFSLGAGANTARLLRDLTPQTENRASDGGFLFIRSSLPIYAIELFFSRNSQVLANVAGGRLAPGITFVPPSR